MSQKNHEITDGRLVQTDKKYSHLKLKQKEKILEDLSCLIGMLFSKALEQCSN